MANVKGTVAYCGYKNIQTKRGTAQIWSFKVKETDEFYNCGFNKPVRNDGVRLLEGDLVKFSYKEDQFGKQVDFDTLQVKEVAVAKGDEDSQPTKKPFQKKGGFNKGGGGTKDDYWAKKEQFDKTVTQPLIMRQSANNVASQLVATALNKDVLPLPSKKADKWEAYMLCYNQVRDEIFNQMMSDYKTLQEGGSIIPLPNVTDEEDPTSDEWKEMDDLDNDTKAGEGDWGDDDWGDK